MGYVDWAQADNGKIPGSRMVSLDGQGHPINPAAKYYFDQWNADFKNQTGRDITVSEAYRDYSTQVYYWNLYQSGKGFPAAYPGTSTHGQALAVDVNSSVYSASNALHDTLINTARNHNWSWELVGKPSGEPWHFNYVGSPTASVPSSGGNNSVATGDDDMRAAYFVVQDKENNKPEYGSMAVFGPLVPEGWRQLSNGLGPRDAFNYWNAIVGTATGEGTAPAVHVDYNGWQMARDAFSKRPYEQGVVNDGTIGVLRSPEAHNLTQIAVNDALVGYEKHLQTVVIPQGVYQNDTSKDGKAALAAAAAQGVGK